MMPPSFECCFDCRRGFRLCTLRDPAMTFKSWLRWFSYRTNEFLDPSLLHWRWYMKSDTLPGAAVSAL